MRRSLRQLVWLGAHIKDREVTDTLRRHHSDSYIKYCHPCTFLSVLSTIVQLFNDRGGLMAVAAAGHVQSRTTPACHQHVTRHCYVLSHWQHLHHVDASRSNLESAMLGAWHSLRQLERYKWQFIGHLVCAHICSLLLRTRCHYTFIML